MLVTREEAESKPFPPLRVQLVKMFVVGANGQRLAPFLNPGVRVTPMTFRLVRDSLKV